MSSKDHDIYSQMGEILFNIAPPNSKEVIVTFSVVAEETISEGSVHNFKYHYIDQSGERDWFLVPSTDAHCKLGDLFENLREYIHSQGQPKWKQCEFTLDLVTGKFSTNFKYD